MILFIKQWGRCWPRSLVFRLASASYCFFFFYFSLFVIDFLRKRVGWVVFESANSVDGARRGCRRDGRGSQWRRPHAESSIIRSNESLSSPAETWRTCWKSNPKWKKRWWKEKFQLAALPRNTTNPYRERFLLSSSLLDQQTKWVAPFLLLRLDSGWVFAILLFGRNTS